MDHSVSMHALAGTSLERALLARLQEVLTGVAWLPEVRAAAPGREADGGVDAIVRVGPRSGVRAELWVQVKRELRPAEFAGWAARRESRSGSRGGVPLLAMPRISPRIAELCRGTGWSWLDLSGNCWIDVPGLLHIERSGNEPVRAAERPSGNLRSAAAARVLRVLLSPGNAGKLWTQRELQARTCWKGGGAPVSLGLVNKLVRHLRDQAFVEDAGDHGVRVRDPSGLLAAWRAAYRFDRHERRNYFTLLKGAALAEALYQVGLDAGEMAAYAAFSAAERQAPHVRQGKIWLYVGSRFLDAIIRHLEAKEVDSGENLVVLVPEDPGVFLSFDVDTRAGERTLGCTDPVQTYVDLFHCGGRGEEAAQALLERRILPAITTLSSATSDAERFFWMGLGMPTGCA